MNSAPEQKKTGGWLIPVLSFVVPFSIFGSIGFFSSMMDTRGFDKPDFSASWGFFFMFGIVGGATGLLIRQIAKWWREPREKS